MATVEWSCTIVSTRALVGARGGRGLTVKVLDRASPTASEPASVDGPTWDEPQSTPEVKGEHGWQRSGSVAVPAGITQPGAVVLCKHALHPAVPEVDFVHELILQA